MANEFGNFATLDPLVTSLIPNTAISNGSNTIITASDPGGDYWCHQSTLTFPVKNGLKIVCEMTYVNDVDSGSVALGIKGQGYETPSSDADHLWYNSASGRGMINNENSETGATYTTGDVIRMEIDASASDGEMSVEFFKNNASQLTETHTFTYTNLHIEVVGRHFGTITMNFGATAFAHTPTSGFVGLSTATLPEPAAINYEDEYFLKTGIIHTTGSTTAVTLPKTVSGGAMVRIKETDATTSWICFDTARGVNKAIFWNLTAAEDSSTYDDQNLTGTTFTMPSDLPSGTYLLECFYVGNFFAILEDEGDGQASRSINHGAGFLPAFIWRKNIDRASYNSVLFHKWVGTGGYLYGSSAAAAITNEGTAGAWAGGTFTTSVIIVGSNNDANQDNDDFISYLWADAGPYSFGKHTGNQLVNGDRVNLGGSPQVMVSKPIAAADSYLAMYRPLLGYNPSGVRQYWEEPYANSTSTSDGVLDFLSNGIKFRTAGTGNNSTNTNYTSYLYFAFGIQPMTDGGANQGRAGAVKPFSQAYGGAISVFNGFFVHSFTSTSTFLATKSGNVELLVVAGGGGGCMGGGGAGGYRTAASQSVTAGTAVTVTIGAGGTAGNTNQDGNGGNGGNSSFGSVLVSTGGGGGADNGTATGAAPTGGSGGGLGENSGGNYSIGQGNAGGFSPVEGNNGGDANDSADAYGGGGGGGSSAVGANGTSSAAGAGGAGTANTITGVSVAYAGGGAGGRITGSDASGGNGGGGASGIAGTANTGGGGGGGRGASAGGTNFVAGAGGTGIVIVRYAIS